MSVKITTWNVEHCARLIGNNLSDIHKERKRRVANTIQAINPDILCLLEAPKGEQAIIDFCKDVLKNKWLPVLLKPLADSPKPDAQYQIKGNQWIWFLVKQHIHQQCTLQPPQTWQAFVGAKTWQVNYWGKEKPTRHTHYRHPQVLKVATESGQEFEIIGQHMKSKINQNKVWLEKDILNPAYLNEALKVRVKLATEARNIRAYIDQRFEQSVNPAIVVLGDANDGIGQDYFERNYMFFDLVSNLQGNIMQAERFLNHALFDFPINLRWSAKYRDKLTKTPASKNPLLIDHILLSQSLVNGEFDLQAYAKSGLVEHHIFEQENAGASSKKKTSDHRPISVNLR